MENKKQKIPYIFFLIHMGVFGFSGFQLAYFDTDTSVYFILFHGGFSILVYLIFYIKTFGIDQIRWLFINSFLGLYGIWFEVDLILSMSGYSIHEFPLYRHIIPFTYYVLYTFLLRQFLLDITSSQGNEERKKIIEKCYVFISTFIYTLLAIIRFVLQV